MDSISISQLKAHPAGAIAQALDYPVAVEKRSQVKAYLVGKDLFDKMITFLEDQVDRAVIRQTDFSKGEDFEKVARQLGI